MSKVHTQTNQALAFLTGEKGATCPTVTGDAMAIAIVNESRAIADKARMGRERLLLATVLAIAATSQVTAGKADVDALNEAAPFHTDPNTRKQYAFILRLSVATHGPRFVPTDRTSYSAVYGEALAYAKRVDVRAEKKARDAAAKAKRDAAKAEQERAEREGEGNGEEGSAPAPKAGQASSVDALSRMKDARLAQGVVDYASELARRIAEGNVALGETLAMVNAMLAPLAKAKARKSAKRAPAMQEEARAA